MAIENNKVVTFHYRVSEQDQELENSRGGEPLAYLHGHGNMLKSLEESMLGREEGDVFSVTLEPEQAYGLRQEDAGQRIPLKHVIKTSYKGKLKPGAVVQINTSHGPREVIVQKVGLKNIDVDTNHPFAGKTLTFDVEITSIRDASEEEIAHGHAHGVGGHHH